MEYNKRFDLTSPINQKIKSTLPIIYQCDLDSPDPCSIYHPKNSKPTSHGSLVDKIRCEVTSSDIHEKTSEGKSSKSSSRLAASLKLASELDISVLNTNEDESIVHINDENIPININFLSSPLSPAPKSRFRNKLYSPSDKKVLCGMDSIANCDFTSPMKSFNRPNIKSKHMTSTCDDDKPPKDSLSEALGDVSSPIQPKPPTGRPIDTSIPRRKAFSYR